ncbi:hypothetical protein DUNSADRAFT_2976 [Dunaliella salina]|uniref:Uncharacterized protein n=1 Tax=Dunaliella salina TaxID=3046 RepID=A0ABQ7GUT0_DUNSA|nr:hypothetical protein DUNSADRAFT_2976 [Dunaliella salina]|eukprot:KAF5838366.1 hypothetical protein DUNSADRAFT_2976 [Dunaliella salina]
MVRASLAASEAGAEDSDADYFFRPLGGVSFTKPSKPLDAPGPCALVTASSRYGLVFFSDLSGLYVVRSSELLKHASKEVGHDSYQPPSPNSVCMAFLKSAEPASQLVLSADQLVLACVSQNSVAFFSIPDAAVADDAKGPSQPPPTIRPVTQLTLDAAIKQFVWCKATEAGAQRYLVVTDDHKCHVSSFPAAPQVAGEDVEAADWQPGSSMLAYSSGNSLVFKDAMQLGMELAKIDITLPDVASESLVVESLQWVSPQVLMLSGSEVEEDQEGGDAYPMQLTLPVDGLLAAAQGQEGALERSSLLSFTPVAVEPESTGTLQGPYLQCAAVGQWEAAVLAHRKANDDHIQLVQYAPEAQQYFVTQDDIRLALPSGPGGEDNYVLGLAVDFCADTGPIPHPLSVEPIDLVSTPILIMATSDAVLRLYAFGHFQRQQPLSHPPEPLPMDTPQWLQIPEEEEEEEEVALPTPPPLEAASARAEAAEDEAQLKEEPQAPTPAVPADAAAPAPSGVVPGAGTVAEKEEEAAHVPLPDSDEGELLGDGESDSGSCQDKNQERANPRAMARKAAIERAESLTARQTLDRTASATSTQTMGAAQQQWQQEQKAAATALPSEGEESELESGGGSTAEAEVHVQRPAAEDSSDSDEVTSSPAAAPEALVGHGKRASSSNAPSAPAAKATSFSPASATGRHATTAPAFHVPSSSAGPSAPLFGWGGKAMQDGTGAESPPPPAPGAAAPTPSVFGAGAGAPAFGGASTTQSPAQSLQPAKSLFGAGFGASVPAWGSAPSPPAIGGGIFGASAVFGSASASQSASAAAPSGGGAPSQGPFGGAPQAPASGGFGGFGSFGGFQQQQPTAATTSLAAAGAAGAKPSTSAAAAAGAAPVPKAKQPPMPSMASVQQAQSLFSSMGMPSAGDAAKTGAESRGAAAACAGVAADSAAATPPESPAKPSVGSAAAFGGGQAQPALAGEGAPA